MINQSILRKVLAVGITLLLAAGGSKADVGYHSVMLKTPPNLHCMHLYGIWGAPPEVNVLRTVLYSKLNPIPGWHYTGYMALNGTQLTVNMYGSDDCFDDFIAQRVLTVPSNDGLRNVWVDMSGQPPPRNPRGPR
jgi:hypothetical protein